MNKTFAKMLEQIKILIGFLQIINISNPSMKRNKIIFQSEIYSRKVIKFREVEREKNNKEDIVK